MAEDVIPEPGPIEPRPLDPIPPEPAPLEPEPVEPPPTLWTSGRSLGGSGSPAEDRGTTDAGITRAVAPVNEPLTEVVELRRVVVGEDAVPTLALERHVTVADPTLAVTTGQPTLPSARPDPGVPTRPHSELDVPPPQRSGPDRAPRSLRLVVCLLLGIAVVVGGAGLLMRVRPSMFNSLRRHPSATPRAVVLSHRRGAHAVQRGAAGAPTLDAIAPTTARPGQSVTISGSGMMSANGVIVAYFGSESAPTSCPSEENCVVQVPPPPRGTRTLAVRVLTESGYSNALSFRYR